MISHKASTVETPGKTARHFKKIIRESSTLIRNIIIHVLIPGIAFKVVGIGWRKKVICKRSFHKRALLNI
ncbi:hypothetical protein MSSIT_2541 [Methanosarcina siciliae T4/M]|uniref:Uncharacterized protein n=2 Tax=Methanosarcina siciliae TaxID=38027 RepID=A0A0E3PFN0_9EURY|nr:hypothetical protein MSSIT_2541 [Methanosarcina siciliae T4/M]AKB33188.1 hypothetical protein MSSIH_2498 [Methanosarcina siciliae HI350]